MLIFFVLLCFIDKFLYFITHNIKLVRVRKIYMNCILKLLFEFRVFRDKTLEYKCCFGQLI